MYNVLIILLHRPFVADGHLYSTTRSISINSLITCASAADSIVALLRTYDRTFSVRRAPYQISYACYVAATIHARIAAKRSAGSGAHGNLETCLAVFRENQETNWAVRRAHLFIQNLMKRLGVMRGQGGNGLGAGQHAPPASPGGQADAGGFNAADATPSAAAGPPPDVPGDTPPPLGWSDVDIIIQGFSRGQDAAHPGAQDAHGFPAGESTVQSRPAGAAAAHPDFGHAMGELNLAWGGNFQDGTSASIDDLLFGFNALDNTPFYDFGR